jgi:hypothetical protein
MQKNLFLLFLTQYGNVLEVSFDENKQRTKMLSAMLTNMGQKSD